jgi:hypothetical protein
VRVERFTQLSASSFRLIRNWPWWPADSSVCAAGESAGGCVAGYGPGSAGGCVAASGALDVLDRDVRVLGTGVGERVSMKVSISSHQSLMVSQGRAK